MSEQKKNYARRVIDCRGPHFRIDSGHPQVGASGAEVFKIYATNDNDDVFLIDHTQGGLSRIYADRTLEVRAGDKNSPGKIDIRVSAAAGNVTVNADNGLLSCSGKNVMVKATQDLDLNGGRNVNITAGSGRVHLKGNTCSASGKRGNLIHKSFGLNIRNYLFNFLFRILSKNFTIIYLHIHTFYNMILKRRKFSHLSIDLFTNSEEK